MSNAALTPHTAHYHSLGIPGPGIRHIWFCLHSHGQPVADFAAQLVNLGTSERLLILPEAPGTARSPVWYTAGALGRDLALVRAYLDALADSVIAACPPHTTITVLGYGHGATAASTWLAGNKYTYDRLFLYASIFPPGIKRHPLFADLPHRPAVVVAPTTAPFTPNAEGESLLSDLLKAGQTAQLRYVDEGKLLTLGALGVDAEARGRRPH